MMRNLLGLLICISLSWMAMSDKALGQIRVGFQQSSQRWQFFDGDRPFISRGVVGVRYEGEQYPGDDKTYGKNLEKMGLSRDAFAKQSAQRLLEWGFNTVGPWSDQELFQQPGLYFTVTLVGAHKVIVPKGPLGRFPDVFNPAFAQAVDAEVAKVSQTYRQNSKLIGYFTDNELEWKPDLLDRFLRLPAGQPGKEAALQFLKERGVNPSGLLDGMVRTAFIEKAAELYFKAYHTSLKKHDPTRLNLGCRFAAFIWYDPAAAKVAGRYVDVISINLYPAKFAAIKDKLLELHKLSGRPILLGEFSVRGRDSNLPNTHGAGLVVPTQADRGKWYRSFICDLLKEPHIVGYHWFRWLDEPAQGRFDGENSNYGLVNVNNQPYRDFIEQVKLQDRPCP